MFVRNPSASLSRWGRTSLLVALTGLPLYASCTTSEDTEPYVPAREGASQPQGKGDLLSEDDACAVLRKAAKDAYSRLHCDAELAECPGFLRPGGGNGCYEYYSDSIDTCQKSYDDATSCRTLSPCLATAVRNDDLPTCEMVDSGTGGAAGAGPVAVGGAGGVSGAAPIIEAGAAGSGGATLGAAGVAGVAGAAP
jgi:hypothetical protein